MSRRITQLEIDQIQRRSKLQRIIADCNQPGWKAWDEYTPQEQHRILFRYDDYHKPQELKKKIISAAAIVCTGCGCALGTAWIVDENRLFCIECHYKE